MKEYAVLVDLAKRRNFTATMVLKDSPQIVEGHELLHQPDRIVHFYDIVFLNQKQRVRYHEIVEDTVALMGRSPLAENADLLVDATGVGEPVVEIMREQHLRPIPIITTPGAQMREVYTSVGELFPWAPPHIKALRTLQEIHVPKADLVAAGQLLVQQSRVRIVRGVRWAQEAREQFKRFKGKINERTKHKVYEAETEEDQDDFVTAFLLGAWWFTSQRTQQEIPEQQVAAAESAGDWNPYDFW